MRIHRRASAFLVALTLAAGVLAGMPVAPAGAAGTSHTFLGDYPKNRNHGWHEEAQGVANDSESWYFTQRGHLLKFPVTFDLNTAVCWFQWPCGGPPPGVRRVGIPNALSSLGYDHFGDIDVHRGYVFVPVEDLDGVRPPRMAAFRAADLAYGGSAPLHADQTKAGWVAVRPATASSGPLLYTSNSTVSAYDGERGGGRIFRYRLDMPRLTATGSLAGAVRYLDRWHRLRTSSGASIRLEVMQGGDFSPAGRLYLSNGGTDAHPVHDGVHLFDASGTRVARSHNGYDPFNYEFHPEWDEEPEGLTWWDRDDGRSPGVRGQLHVILLDNDGCCWDDDDFYLKHYRVG